MIAYIDACVLLRIVLDAPEPLPEWKSLEVGVSSRLLHVECYRVLDRLWHQGELDPDELAVKRLGVEAILGRFDLLPIDDEVLRRAAEPLPTPLAALDALHLATAMIYRSNQPPDERPIAIATHDRALARAAASMNFEVLGG